MRAERLSSDPLSEKVLILESAEETEALALALEEAAQRVRTSRSPQVREWTVLDHTEPIDVSSGAPLHSYIVGRRSPYRRVFSLEWPD